MLDEKSNVFKLYGCVLIKSDVGDAKENVEKRIEYINSEMYPIYDLINLTPFVGTEQHN